MNIVSRRVLALSAIATACALSACKEPQKPADFAPSPGEAATTVAPAAGSPLVNAPVELTYEQRRTTVSAGGRCNLERVNGAKFAGAPVPVSKGSPVQLGGWIADADAKSVPSTFDVRLVSAADQRTWRVASQAGESRPDVQKLLGGDAALAGTGYASEFDVSALPNGTYRLYTVFVKNAATLACDNGRAIVIGP
jgi:hypothetical protein